MNTTKYLSENYKFSVVDDSVAIGILSDLYTHMPKSESELSADYPNSNIKNKIAKLFKASLIEKTFNDTWRVSDFGKLIINRLDMANFIVEYLLKNWDLDQDEYFFLSKSIEVQSVIDENYYNSIASYIKLLNFYKQFDIKGKDTLKKSLYCYIIGLDENINRIGTKEYVKFIFLNNNKPDRINKKRWESNIDRFEHLCNYSKFCTKEINNIYLTVNRHNYKEFSFSDDTVKITAFLRCINPILNKECDDTLSTLYKFNKEFKYFKDIAGISEEIEWYNKVFEKRFNSKNIFTRIFNSMDTFIEKILPKTIFDKKLTALPIEPIEEDDDIFYT